MTELDTQQRAHELLRGAILSTDHERRYALLDEVGRLGVRAERDLPLLIELLDPDHHWFARALAVWEIGKLGPSAGAAVPYLARLAAERETIIDPRWASLWALERLGPASAPAVPTLLDLLRSDHEPDMRSEAAFALGALGVVQGVVHALLDALRDGDSLVREEAAAALGRIGVQAASTADELVRLAMDDEVRPVREAAVRALRRMNEDEHAARAEAASMSAVSPPATLSALLERLASDDARTRAETSWPIGKLGADAAPGLPAIVRQLRGDHDPDARWGAAWCVGRIGPAATPAVPEVVAAVRQDGDPDVRAQAAQALGRIGSAGDGVIEVLLGALADEGASLLREEAAVALGRIGPDASIAVPALRARLADRHPMVRLRAGAALAVIVDEL
jgi:HEAT repeat protein